MLNGSRAVSFHFRSHPPPKPFQPASATWVVYRLWISRFTNIASCLVVGFRLPDGRQCYRSCSFRGSVGCGIFQHNRICHIHSWPKARCKVGVPIPCSSCKEDLEGARLMLSHWMIYNPRCGPQRHPRKRMGWHPPMKLPASTILSCCMWSLNILICFNHRNSQRRNCLQSWIVLKDYERLINNKDMNDHTGKYVIQPGLEDWGCKKLDKISHICIKRPSGHMTHGAQHPYFSKKTWHTASMSPKLQHQKKNTEEYDRKTAVFCCSPLLSWKTDVDLAPSPGVMDLRVCFDWNSASCISVGIAAL